MNRRLEILPERLLGEVRARIFVSPRNCPILRVKVRRMMCRYKRVRIGQSVTVKNVWGGYLLPEGLPSGAAVKLLRFDHGYYDVDYNGQTFSIFLVNVNSGMKYFLNERRWLDENHPLIAAAKRGEARRRF